jgi:hypothetical protein
MKIRLETRPRPSAKRRRNCSWRRKAMAAGRANAGSRQTGPVRRGRHPRR